MDYLNLTSAMILALTSPILSLLLVGANPQNSESVEIAQVNFEQPKPPPDDTPGSQVGTGKRGTGSRGNCPIAASGQGLGISLMPIIPEYGWGKIASESPTVWVYISYSNGAVATPITGEISIEEIDTNRRLPPGKVTISLPTQSGAFPITFASSLEANKWYRWYLVIDCTNPESGDNPSFLSTEGLIYRETISPPLPATPQERLQFYANKGFWYDAINEAGEIYCRQPPDIANLNDWKSLWQDGNFPNELNPELLICPTEEQVGE
ncbi:DUF928 domain-containing protein [[Phormidium] sp. ETS-05]|uniref:DUF928 domain-containing protein n=1 Tax=[Phormidium] sp. ETS-05 TaxID=222819 RepID=UPI0018EEDC09|nr:DUF928 domain-containing protein [[Phormidium] sp. ETS-05]